MFRRTPSRGGRGRRAAVDFVVCFGCGGGYFVFFRYLYFLMCARVHDRWLRETQGSQRRLGEGATTDGQSAHRELAPTDPHQVYHLL